jgi:calcium/calmodulin-dependent protein kinase (CaM kinase) II
MDNGSETYSVLNLTQKLLDAISNKDWDIYCLLTDEKLTCVEPETGNSICEGFEFHKTYFDIPRDENLVIKENILQPVTKLLNDVAIITYKRVRQVINMREKNVEHFNSTETRVWRRVNESWKMVHFHRS